MSLIFSFYKKNSLKLISIFLSILIWTYVHFSLTYTEKYRKIKVKIITNEKQKITEIIKDTITITLKGARENLNKITLKDFEIKKIIPTKIMPGLQKLTIYQNEVKILNNFSNISIANISGNIEFYADNIISKTVQVQPAYESFLDNNYEIKAKILNPNIKIYGPSLIVKNLRTIKTIPIMVEHYNKSHFDTPALIENIQNISFEHKKVTISFEIFEKRTIIHLANIPIHAIFLGTQNIKLTTKLPNAEIILNLPLESKKKLNSETDFKLYIEIPQSPLPNQFYKINFMTNKTGLNLKKIIPSQIKISTIKL